tara:strand:+ start:128 stop:523 length:396 start_codon:yes stop_codon:yes gene_type:complete
MIQRAPSRLWPSSGGQIMPPVMGTAAFLMATFLGTSYIQVVLAGIVPALLYFLAVSIGVQIIAKKERIRPSAERPNIKMLLFQGPMFIIPMIMITVLLYLRFSPSFVAFWTIIITLLLTFMSRNTRISLTD